MRKAVSLLLLLALLCACASASELIHVGEGERVDVDLDGDGTDETLLWKMLPGSNEDFDDCIQLFVEDDEIAHTETDILRGCDCLVTDLNGDGGYEIYISGDVQSDDYYTWGFIYEDGGFTQLKWDNCCRAEDERSLGRMDRGYGHIGSVSTQNEIELIGTQDLLGTWYFSRTFRLGEDGLVFDDDGLFRMREEGDPFGEEGFGMSAKQDIPAKFDDEDGVIHGGERFVITASDLVGTVLFRTEKGRSGSFAIEPDAQEGFGSLIGGKSENDMIDGIVYRD